MNVTRAGQTFDVVPHVELDGWDFWEHFSTDWEPESFDTLDEYLTPDSTFVDIGAWIGPLTLWASRRCGRVIAVEPDPVALAELRQNTMGCSNVEIVPAAISDYDGIGMLGSRGHSDEGEFGNSMSSLDAASSVTFQVETMTLTTLWERHQIEDVGLVKIDIEGGEANIFPDPILNDLPVLLSFHGPWLSPAAKNGLAAVLNVSVDDFGTILV